MLLFALLNRAAGSDFFGFIRSSLLSRMLATFLMAHALVGFDWSVIVVWAGLMFWRTIAGSSDAGAALHGWEVDGYLSKYTTWIKDNRIRGCLHQGIKHLAIVPLAPLCGGMWFLIPLIPFVYYGVGLVVKDDRALGFCELIIGGIVWLVCA
jgi:hypothetical protein